MTLEAFKAEQGLLRSFRDARFLGVVTTAPVLSMSNRTQTSISVQATEVPEALNYEFQRNNVTQQDSTSRTFNDSGLTASTDYDYRSRGKNASGNGPWSGVLTVRTLDPVEDPPPPTGGVRFFYSDADVSVFQSRMQNGPYKSWGDAGHGGGSSPNDGDRALSHANTFMQNPTAERWHCPHVPTYPWMINEYPNAEPYTNYIRFLRAAWCYMTLPNHGSRNAWRDAVKDIIWYGATHPNNDYSNSTNYPATTGVWGSGSPPIFAWAGWIKRMLKARDFLGRDVWTTQQNATIDRWFYSWANFTFRWIHETTGTRFGKTKRLNRDYSGPVSGSTLTSWRGYDYGPFITEAAAYSWTNRHNICASSASLVANYLKFYGVQPSTSGGPTYGWLTVDEMIHHSRVYFEEWMVASVYPAGFMGDMHRGWGSNRHSGWMYCGNELNGMVSAAVAHARRGDNNLLNWATQLGVNTSAGSPNNTSGGVISGFPDKTVEFAAWSYSRQVPNPWNRTIQGGTIPPSGPYMDVLPAARLSRYVSNTYIQSAWRRSGNGFPGYPSSPDQWQQGAFNVWDGEQATDMGLIECAPTT
jgi:hypothetical protein